VYVMTKLETELVTVDEASRRLGKGFSRRSIVRRIDRGEWIEGVEWVDDRHKGAINRQIRINLVAVQAWRQKPATER